LVPKVLVLVFEPVEPPMLKFAIGWPAPKAHVHRSRDLKVKRVSCQLEPAVLVARRRRTPSDSESRRRPPRRPSIVALDS
jgi:hypothetical protein